MTVERIAAFSDAGKGGNPAGIAIADQFPPEAEMRRIAAEVGYSETAFAVPDGAAEHWRVRYFSPESEVAFCGHATIALGAALARHSGDGRYHLKLNTAEITVAIRWTSSIRNFHQPKFTVAPIIWSSLSSTGPIWPA